MLQADRRASNQEETESARDEIQCDSRTVCRDSWGKVFINRSNFEYVKSLHSILMAEAAVDDFARVGESIHVFIHGDSFAVADKASGKPLDGYNFFALETL